MLIKKVQETIPNMSKVIGASDTPNDKDVYSSNAVNTLIQDVYSTTDEIKTNKVWKGKPIYRKVIEYTTSSSEDYPEISLANIDFDTIYFANGTHSLGNSRYVGADANQYMARYIDKINKKIIFINDGRKVVYTCNVLEYTKTTD